ncbi:hypothetical protein Clacol_008999 [Clathrus columnatus]|uniref:Uncharacterized protein n=1 Tax=Clathrus columnatus TaxID=1419009 RepID=A0AAV5AJB0_9AGAM|nr:hypothetical protein Clacol_008999 [Clathrus columnatus]
MSALDGSSPTFPQQKRVIPPPMPIDLPEPPAAQYDAFSSSPVSRSPLRNSIIIDPNTGTISEDGSAADIDNHDPWGQRTHNGMSHSPSPSITKFASSFAQKVGSLVSSASPHSQNVSLPTEAEIEADAEYQRERSRREAERILSLEARERKKVEERVLEMLGGSSDVRPRSQTLPPSPTPSNKEGGLTWWNAAKNRLTPGKEKDLTPAQQIIAETKAKEKDKRKSKDKDVFSDDTIRSTDPNRQALSLPPGARPPSAMVGGGASFVERPTPSTQKQVHPRTPSPARSSHEASLNFSLSDLTRVPGASPSLSTASSKDAPPLYAQFTPQGILDISGKTFDICSHKADSINLATLLTIARRFEKLERWSVNHVRALEDRMGDVEKWLVDKEKERQRDITKPTSDSSHEVQSPSRASPQVVREVTIERKTVEIDQEVKKEVNEMKEELGELRSRVSELGREMAKLGINESLSHPATPSEVSGFGIGRLGSPVFSSAGPSTPAMVKPKTQTVTSRHERDSPSSQSILQSETASIISSSTVMRTKLPYPTGDYTSPSPPNSPRGSVISTSAVSNLSRTRPMSNEIDVIPNQVSPNVGNSNAASPAQSAQQVSASPRARKRYTVALGQPLSSSPSPSPYNTPKDKERLPLNLLGDTKLDFGEDLFSEPQAVQLETAFISNLGHMQQNMKENDESQIILNDDDVGGIGGAQLRRQETIGKTPITLSRLSTPPPPSQVSTPSGVGLHRSPARASNSRLRAQSTYGTAVPSDIASSPAFSRSSTNLSTLSNTDNVERKLSLKSRTRSIDRFNLRDPGTPVGGSNFIDPLAVRKKATTANRMSVPVPAPGQRGRVADLRAFFDPEKQ